MLRDVISILIESKQPKAQRLLRGLGLAWMPPDENGFCSLTISRPHKKKGGAWMEVCPSEEEVKIVKHNLKALLSQVAFQSLRVSSPTVVTTGDGSEQHPHVFHTIIQFTWCYVKMESML